MGHIIEKYSQLFIIYTEAESSISESWGMDNANSVNPSTIYIWLRNAVGETDIYTHPLPSDQPWYSWLSWASMWKEQGGVWTIKTLLTS